MGKQRKGDIDPIKYATNHLDHIQKAIALEFSLARKIPLPEEMREANKCITSTPPESIIAFWTKQLTRNDATIEQATTLQNKWQKQTPDAIGRVGGDLKTVTIAQLLNRYNMGGQNWIRHFVFGFPPLIGTLSQKGVFPKGCELDTDPTQPQQIWEKSQARFLERSARDPDLRMPDDFGTKHRRRWAPVG